MKRGKLIALVATVGILSSSLTYVQAAQTTVNTKRIQGNNRYITSVEVSKTGWTSGSENVILASGENFPDALCAVPLSKKFDAPILLCGKDTIQDVTLKEIQRLKPKKIFIMGLKGSISQEVETKIKQYNANVTIERVGGNDRYETSVKAAEKFNNNKVVITSGEKFADALSIAAIAAQMDTPIILTEKNSMPLKAQNYIKLKGINEAIIVGGTGIISSNVEKIFGKSQRLGGLNRYETNSKVVSEFKNQMEFKKVFLAVGGPANTDFADALSGAALAAKESSPVILIDKKSNSIKDGIIDSKLIKNSQSIEIVTLGGGTLIKEGFISNIKATFEKVLNGINNQQSNNSSSTNIGNNLGGTGTLPTTGGVTQGTESALASINNANESTIAGIITSRANEIGINLSSFNTLNAGKQSMVCSDLLDNRPQGGFASLGNVKTIFEELVSTRKVIGEELDKINAAVDSKSIDSIKGLEFLTRVKAEIDKSSYTKLSGYVLSIWVSQVDSEYNKLQTNKDEKLKKLIQKKYSSYSEVLETLYDINRTY